MRILSEVLSGALLGMTEAGCQPLPYNTTAAESALNACASTTVDFTTAVLFAVLGMLFGAAIAVSIFNYLLARGKL